ncbi:MAG: serine/threonine-protein kinase [Flavobacteriales bacterium]|nr:MAG: serine/threonine-protein kinase [Flavobacteriales bacterium]
MGLLRNIHAISSVPFGPNTPFTAATEIAMEEQPLNQGGFGAVYRLHTVDGRSVRGALVKVMFNEEHGEHAYETVRLLHEKLRGRFHDALTIEHPELLGMPFFLFRAENDEGEPVVAMALCDLGTLGFEDMGSDSWDAAAYFRNTSPLEKLHLAYQFARTVDVLHNIGFLHADLKDKSIFLNTRQPQLALIDFDSGFHPDTQGAASTLGALSQWASAKLRGWIKSKQSPGQLSIDDRQDEERWALASGVFELLSGVAPFFFLRDADDNSIAKYLKEHKWPEVDPNSALVNPANLAYHEAMLLLLQELEDSGGKDLVAAFKRTFNRGYYKPGARPKPAEWKVLLGNLCKQHVGSPAITSLQGDRDKIHRKGEPVNLTWSATQHRALLLDGRPLPFGATAAEVAPSDTTVFTLKAISDFGTAESTFKVEAVKTPPVIHGFNANKHLRDTLEPVVLEWATTDAVEIRILPVGSTVELSGTIEVLPEAPTTYELQAYGGFGQLAVAHVHVEVASPLIESFDWEVNLLKGIDNVDLIWRTRNTVEVLIEGQPGVHPPEGVLHVPIRQGTPFTLTAKGLFGTTSASLKAYPFPVPVIEQMAMDFPLMNMTTEVTIPAATFLVTPLDRSLLAQAPTPRDLGPGYLRDQMGKELSALNEWQGHWILSGRAIWDRITGNKTDAD